MNITRNKFVRALAATAFLISAGQAALAQAWPSKPVRIIVPFPPGGSTDVLARILSQKLSEKWGQSVLIDNRPGGNTLIAAQLVAQANDGHTLFMPIDFTLTCALPVFAPDPNPAKESRS